MANSIKDSMKGLGEKVKNLKKKPEERGNMGVYSNLATQKKSISERAKDMKSKISKKTKNSPKKELAPLPKEPWKRFWAHFRWERIKAYWFSKAGLKRIGKIFAACILLGIIGVGALFMYYKNQIKEIELNDLTISETVNTYLDRNGVVLWEDKGDSDYRLVVDGEQIAQYARQATVAIEDRNFYSHAGVDFGALVRATLSTLGGKGVQGGSTLTQQLIKQVYFADEAASKNRGGISRKIRELILAIELEKMYSKEQIITMYLNESPYGGRRNGIESAAQTYFGKSAAELTLAESALLAAIPNNPAVLNPYNTAGNEALLARQRKTLDVMAELGYITQEEANEAKEVPVLDQILPESNQYKDIKAPHFVMEVKKKLEEKYGIQTMRQGGYTITTTLDYRAQEIAQAAVATGAGLRYTNGSDNIALASVDVDTSQVLAMVGSVDWNTPIYGEVNATTTSIEPGSTIKPILDYAALFSMQDGDMTYGPGTITVDENIDSFYCAGYTGSCMLHNATGKFYGRITFRESLANSLNIGAVKALATVGIDKGLEVARALGDVSYCQDNTTAGLSMAIGSGCGVKLIEHANAYASLARGGTYKDLVYVLEIKEPGGKVLESWQDNDGTRVIDEQVAYEISSILSDAEARAKYNFGQQSYSFGFIVPGVWTASKTGTTTTAKRGQGKDSLMASYSTAIATVVWNGNHDGSGLTSTSNTIVRRVINDYMERVHKEIYGPEGKWKSGDQPTQPAGIQTLTVNGRTDIWPSWYNSEKTGATKEMVEFNADTGLQASECTPANKRISIEVIKFVDPISGSESYSVAEPYKYGEMDPCVEEKPATSTPSNSNVPVATITPQKENGKVTNVVVAFNPPSGVTLSRYIVYVDGAQYQSGSDFSDSLTVALSGSEKKVVVEVTDADGHKHTHTYNVPSS